MTKTVRLKVVFGAGDGVTKVLRSPVAATKPTGSEPGRVARLLALAYRIEQLIEDGVLTDYRQAAQRLGISAAHLTHTIALLDLAVPIQEDILLGKANLPERRLRNLLTSVCWATQRMPIATDSSAIHPDHPGPIVPQLGE